MTLYYNKVLRTAVPGPAHDPGNPDEIALDPGNVFWTVIPDDHELTFDVDGIPNGTQPIAVPIDYVIRQDLMAANITQQRLTIELFKESQSLPNDLATIYTDIQTIAANNSVVVGVVLDVI